MSTEETVRSPVRFIDLDDPLRELQTFADMTMTWFHGVVEAQRLHKPGVITLQERDRAILEHALGELWERACAANRIFEAAERVP